MSAAWEMKEEYRALFLEESQDQIREWEESLLSLEKEKEDREQINRLFRAIHTLKGSAGFVGFSGLQELTHGLESALQSVRDGERKLDASMMELLFEGHDLCRRMIEAFGRGEPFEGDGAALVEKLLSMEKEGEVEPQRAAPETARPVDLQEAPKGNRGDPANEDTRSEEPTGNAGERFFAFDMEIEARGQEASLRAFLLQSRLEGIGKILRVKPSFEELKLLKEDYKFEIVLSTTKSIDEMNREINIDQVRLVAAREINSGWLDENREEGKQKTSAEKAKQPAANARAHKSDEVVRVPVEKLDVMLNLVGELVVQNSGFVSTTNRLRDMYGRSGLIVELEEKTEQLANIARDLQDAVMKVRMLPVANVFNRFNRVVRDLAKDRGKKVQLGIFGEETEIDKKVMDRIGEPLVHLVRNAVDHGIESGKERAAAGKEEIGRIRLGAYQEGDHICIEVSDDGRGLDREKILKKAVEKGMLRKEEAGSVGEENILGLIFHPGFSTAETVTDVSGRGVGLDVVKRTVEEMGGVVRITSQRGRGTSTVITLPLTMAIIPAIMVEVCGSLFAVPLSSVKEVIKARGNDLKRVGNTLVIQLREEVLSVVELRDVLEIEGNGLNGHERPIVIVDYGGKKTGIIVDRLLGNEEIVIKSLSRHYQEVDGMIGASIMGNGKIALILDVEALIRSQFREPHREDNGHRPHAELETIDADDAPPPLQDYDGEKSGHSQASENDGGNEESPTGKKDTTSRDFDDVKIAPEGLGSESTEFERERREAIEEIHAQGAISASISMSQLMHRDIRVSFPETKVVPIGELAGYFGGQETAIGGIYVPLKNELNGGILLVLPADHLYQLCDVLYGRDAGITKTIADQDISGLLEMGNILSASFINAIADRTGMRVSLEVPEIRIDMCQSVIDSVIARFNQPGDRIILTEAELFYGDMEQAICYLLMFLEPKSLSRLAASLDSGVSENFQEKASVLEDGEA
jgi:chemotaxis protein histidine kinase CheA/chemotaxis protein CheY-P-specific phosphatase CheC